MFVCKRNVRSLAKQALWIFFWVQVFNYTLVCFQVVFNLFDSCKKVFYDTRWNLYGITNCRYYLVWNLETSNLLVNLLVQYELAFSNSGIPLLNLMLRAGVLQDLSLHSSQSDFDCIESKCSSKLRHPIHFL